jgi:hypothetical protein
MESKTTTKEASAVNPLRNELEDDLKPENTIPPGNRNQAHQGTVERTAARECCRSMLCESAIIARKPDSTDRRAFFNCRPYIEFG